MHLITLFCHCLFSCDASAYASLPSRLPSPVSRLPSPVSRLPSSSSSSSSSLPPSLFLFLHSSLVLALYWQCISLAVAPSNDASKERIHGSNHVQTLTFGVLCQALYGLVLYTHTVHVAVVVLPRWNPVTLIILSILQLYMNKMIVLQRSMKLNKTSCIMYLVLIIVEVIMNIKMTMIDDPPLPPPHLLLRITNSQTNIKLYHISLACVCGCVKTTVVFLNGTTRQWHRHRAAYSS
jgi:hypothetical protein